MDIEKKLAELAMISGKLDPQEQERSGMLENVRKGSEQFLKALESKAGYSLQKAKSPIQLNPLKPEADFNKLIEQYFSDVAAHGIQAASAAHLGYIPGGGLFASALADFLVDLSNEYAGMHFASPGAVEMENAILDWLKGIFGFPSSAVGNLSSGGSIANLIALTAARDAKGIKGDKIEKSVIYASSQTHHCILKAIRIIGLGDILVRELKLDAHSKVEIDSLEKQIAVDRQNGLKPFLLIASAGTTDTGSIDPLENMGAIAEEHEMWYHIDAAYGGFFILVDSEKSKFKGIEQADSLVVDPHKGLFLPYGIGAVLVKNKEAVLQSHHYRANYMQDTLSPDWQANPADLSPELTKHFRGLRMWLPLQHHGIAPFKACLEEKLLLTEYFRQGLKELGFKLGPTPDLSVSYFWMEGQNLEDENRLTEQLMTEMHKDGDIFLSSTLLRLSEEDAEEFEGKSRFVIRLAILSFRTKKDTIDRALAMCKRCKARIEKLA